jgi:hypothetical protein
MQIIRDGVELRIARGGFVRVAGFLDAVARLTLTDGTNNVEILLHPDDRKRLAEELRFGDSVHVPPEYNEMHEERLREQRQREKG